MLNLNNEIRNVKIFGKDYDVYNVSCCSNTEKRTLYIELLDICNARCSFCSAGCHNPKEKYNIIDISKLKIVLDELINNHIIDKVSLTGGEPTIMPQLDQVLNLLDSYDKLEFYAITTNGTLLKEKMDILEKLKVKYINISRHHYDDYTNNYIFGVTTISSKDIAKIVKKSSKEFRFNITIMERYNTLGHISEFIKLAKKCKVNNILIRKDYNDQETLLDGGEILRALFGNVNITEKVSNKCRCHVVKSGKVTIEYRDVDMCKEHNIESSHGYIRNFVYRSNNELRGGWSEDSILLK